MTTPHADLKDHTALIERLERAEAGSAELDALVIVAVADEPNTYVVEPSPDSIFSHQPGWYRTGADLSCKADPVTTSIDAALALVERVLPGWFPNIDPRFFIDGEIVRWKVTLIRPLWDQYNPVENEWFERVENSTAHSPALAIIIALLKALRSQQKDAEA